VTQRTDESRTQAPRSRPNPRSRSSTMRSYTQPEPEPEPIPEVRPTIRSNTSRQISQSHMNNSPRPTFARATTYDNAPSARRDLSPAYPVQLARIPSDSLMVKTARMNLRTQNDADVFADDSSPDGDRAASPISSNASSSGRRAPPPPPPSRSKKPPPPVPQKRASVIYT
jgi:hypothetical protein